MSQTISQAAVSSIISRVNSTFEVNLLPEDFKSATYSVNSLCDIVTQKIEDEKSGDWTSDIAFHKLRNAISKVNVIAESEITVETELDSLFAPTIRKGKLKELETTMGVPIQVLRPNNAFYGTFIFLFFAGIPLFSLGWFPAVFTMVISGIVIVILNKTGNQFKMKTVGLLADHLAWKNYNKGKQNAIDFDRTAVRNQVASLLEV